MTDQEVTVHTCHHPSTADTHPCECKFGADHFYPFPHPKGDLATAPGMDEHLTE